MVPLLRESTKLFNRPSRKGDLCKYLMQVHEIKGTDITSSLKKIEQAFENAICTDCGTLHGPAGVDRARSDGTSTRLMIAYNEEGYSLWRTKD